MYLNKGKSLELGHGVAVALEGSVDDIGTVVVHVRDDGLVHGTVPLYVARRSVTVPVTILVRVMVHRVLTSPPLAMCIRNWGVLGKHTGHGPVEQVWVVGKGLGIQGVIVQTDGTVVTETLSESPDHEVGDPDVSDTATCVEVLDGELTDDGETEDTTDLGAGGVVCPVPVRLVAGSGDFLHLAAGEPGSEDGELFLGLGSPGGHDFLKVVFGHTEANKVVVGDVFGLLGVDLSALHIIVGILLSLSWLPGGTVLAT